MVQKQRKKTKNLYSFGIIIIKTTRRIKLTCQLYHKVNAVKTTPIEKGWNCQTRWTLKVYQFPDRVVKAQKKNCTLILPIAQ